MMVHKQQDGFTLIEVLVSISLLTIALLGLCGATVMAMKGNSLSQMSTKATIMAKDKIEGLKNLNYNTDYGWGGYTGGKLHQAMDCHERHA